MATVTLPGEAAPKSDGRRAVRDSLIVVVGGQLEQVLGTFTSLALRWGLDLERMGIYSSLRVLLDYANWSSLGVGLGAVQEIPILRAAGKEDQARRVADVAYTATTLLCLAYAAGLLGWSLFLARSLDATPLARDWAGGLAIVAGLALLHRYQTFLIAVLRAHQEFALTTELAVLDSLVFAALAIGGLALAGLWGLWAAIGLLFAFNIAFLRARSPLRFRWGWDGRMVARLMRVGLPILANTAAFGVVLHLDKALILRYVPDGTRAAGLYSIALMGTGWGLDLASRVSVVMYTYFQTTLGRTNDFEAVARQSARTVEALAPILAAGAAVAYLVGPVFLGQVNPGRYAEGLPALRPLLPGTVLLGLAWPARQMLIAVGHPRRLLVATLAGLVFTAETGTIGANRAGLVGVAWGISAGYAGLYFLTSASAFARALGGLAWFRHQASILGVLAFFAAGAILADRLPLPAMNRWSDFAARCLILAAWGLPPLGLWGKKHRWGGVFDRKSRDALE